MTEKQVVKYSIVEAEIAKWENIYMDLSIDNLDDKEEFDMVHSARITVKNGRVAIEKERKALNSEALKWQKQVNGRAKELFALIEPIETHLQNEENKVIEEQKRIEAEEAERERKNIEARIDELMKVNWVMPFMEVATLTDEEYDTLLFDKTEDFKIEQDRIKKEAEAKVNADAEAAEARRIEGERLEKQKAEQDIIAADLKRQQDEIAAQQKALQDEKDRIAREEQARIDAKNALKDAEENAREEIEREKKEAREREIKVAEEAKRQKALKPEKTKLVDWIKGYGTNPIPDLGNKELDDILQTGLERIEETLNWMLRQIDSL